MIMLLTMLQEMKLFFLNEIQDMKFLSQLPWKEQKEQDLLVLPTDAALFEDPSFKVELELSLQLLFFFQDRSCID
jgi:hypothetical protein